MNILSRGQLIELIKYNSVETHVVSSNEHKVVKNTIILNERNELFYRIVWGNVLDNSNQVHLWFDKEMEVVQLNDNGEWMTRSELWDYNNRYNLHPIKDLALMNTRVYKSRKDAALLKEISIAICEGRRVLLVTNNPREVMDDVINVISERPSEHKYNPTEIVYDKKESLDLISENVLFINKELTNEVEVINEMNLSYDNIGYVMLDGLLFDKEDEYNVKKIVKVHEMLDDFAQVYDCEIGTTLTDI